LPLVIIALIAASEHQERGKKWLQGTGPASGIPNLASGSLSDYVCAALREDA